MHSCRCYGKIHDTTLLYSDLIIDELATCFIGCRSVADLWMIIYQKYIFLLFSCFIKIDNAFYFSHLLFLAIVVVINTIIFGLIMHRLTCGRKTKRLSRNKREETLKRVQNAISISLLLGLTWVFGLLSLFPNSSLVLQFLFCIFNSLQGLLIFVMFCVRQEEVVATWKEWISCGKPTRGHGKLEASRSSSVNSNTGQKTTSITDVTLSERKIMIALSSSKVN